jgi:hypothetical protein
MGAEVEPSTGGLTLAEARLRYVPKDLRAKYDDAISAFEARQRATPGWRMSRVGYLNEYGEFIGQPDRLERAVALALHECEANLRERLALGDLWAWGTKGSEAGDRVLVRSLSWRKLRLDFGRSRVRAAGKPPVLFFDVRVYECEPGGAFAPQPVERKPVSAGIELAFARLKARGDHQSWQSLTEGCRAIRREFDGKGDDKNALKSVADKVGLEIKAIVEENLGRIAEEIPDQKSQGNKG